jgi:aminoglycoside phosphotransferase (APT) family kinase protein
LEGEIDTAAASAGWESALAAPWHGPPVWVHGDVTATNLLVVGGRLAGVLDFGCMAVGDPACDLAIAWTLFHGDSRQVFRGAGAGMSRRPVRQLGHSLAARHPRLSNRGHLGGQLIRAAGLAPAPEDRAP